VAWLPWLLFALPGGVLVDRVDRRRLMVAIDWMRVAAMGILTIALLTGRAGIVLLDAVLFVINTGEVVFRSASQAMIPSVVPRARLERANGWLVGGTTLMQGMITGPLAGFLFVLAAWVPFFVNTGTYAASAVLVGLATTRSAYLAGLMMFAFGVHAALWTIVGSSLRQRLTPPQMLGRVSSTTLFIAAGGNCVGAVLGGVIAARFGITAPFWAGFVVAALVSAATWRVFNRATVAQAYAEPAPSR